MMRHNKTTTKTNIKDKELPNPSKSVENTYSNTPN